MRGRWSRAVVLLAAGAVAMSAQQPDAGMLQPLHEGRLTIWVLTHARESVRPPLGIADARPLAPMGYTEQSAGTFGQSASSYGTASSNVGAATTTPGIAVPPAGTGYHEQTSGSFGQPSSNTGTESSNYGQTASSVGQVASSYGTESSNHGQTASSLGHSLSTIAKAGEITAHARTPVAAAFDLAGVLKEGFPELDVKYVSVERDELKPRLIAAEGTAEFPDLLVGELPPVWWTDQLQQRFGVMAADDPLNFPDGVMGTPQRRQAVTLLAAAPHALQARLLLLWASELGGCTGCALDAAKLDSTETTIVRIARNAVASMARGDGIGSYADPEMAPMDAVSRAVGASDDVSPKVDVINMMRNGALAVVQLRVVTSGDRVFGITHPLAVLRKQKDGTWKVLHVSLNLSGADLQAESVALNHDHTEPHGLLGRTEELKGISKAAPKDGDVRPVHPQLWWDNLGGAGVQVVEWQVEHEGNWMDARLFLIDDQGARLRTQVPAAFASFAAKYRWRVWSVGLDGHMILSPWSTFIVQP